MCAGAARRPKWGPRTTSPPWNWAACNPPQAPILSPLCLPRPLTAVSGQQSSLGDKHGWILGVLVGTPERMETLRWAAATRRLEGSGQGGPLKKAGAGQDWAPASGGKAGRVLAFPSPLLVLSHIAQPCGAGVGTRGQGVQVLQPRPKKCHCWRKPRGGHECSISRVLHSPQTNANGKVRPRDGLPYHQAR